MQEVATLTLAAMLTISGWFHNGLKALKSEQYDQAVSELTKVYEKDVPGNVLRDQALFFRAHAHQGKGDKEMALADMRTLIKGAKDPALREQSLALFKKWGGDPAELRPDESPKAVWQKFVAFAQKGELDACLKMTSGRFRDLLKNGIGGDSAKLERTYSETTFTVLGERVGTGKDAGKAWVHLRTDGTKRDLTIGLLLDKGEGRWVLDSLRVLAPKREKPPAEPADDPAKK